MQDMWQVSCWHEGDNEREQGLALLKKAEEILASKNNNRAKIVATRAHCATTHKMHICRERYNSRIQSKTKTQRESTRMHRAKVAQSCAAQKGENPPKRKVSEQSKDAACEQQNAPRKCSNEDVATKKQVRSRYAREDPSKITANTLLRVQALPGRFPPKTRYKRATRRATSVQSTRYCVQRRTTASENHFALSHDVLFPCAC